MKLRCASSVVVLGMEGEEISAVAGGLRALGMAVSEGRILAGADENLAESVSPAGTAYVIVCRHPASAADALAEREGLEFEPACFFWLGRMLDCIAEAAEHSPLFVDYERLLADPAGQWRRIVRHLAPADEGDGVVAALLAMDAHSLRCVDHDAPPMKACPAGVVELYALLSRLAGDEIGFDSLETALPVARICAAFRDEGAQLRYCRALEQRARRALAEVQTVLAGREKTLAEQAVQHERRVAELSRTISERDGRIDALLQTHSWRATAPLRVLGYQARRAGAAYRFGKTVLGAYGGGWRLLQTARGVLAREGWRGLRQRLANTLHCYKSTGGVPPRLRYAQAAPPEEIIDLASVADGPLLSVIIPIYDPPAQMLEAAIQSVRKQSYGHWELILVDDCSRMPHVSAILRRHAAADKRIRIFFRESNGNISAALNTGLDLCTAEHFTILDHDDLLDKHALYWVARALLEQPEADYLYSDEDKVSKDGKCFYGPFFKPDWSPEYFLAMMYTCHLGVYRTRLARDLGGYRSEFDGAQDYDLTLRVVAKARQIVHVPRLLYHWRVWEQSTASSPDAKPLAAIRARQALEEYLSQRGENFSIGDGPLPGHHKVVFTPRGDPLISIVIPTANREMEIGGRVEKHLDAVIESIFEKTPRGNFEVVVVHNGNLSTAQTAALRARGSVRLVAYEEETFNLSAKINLGCGAARGEYLLIMNDDIRVVSENWLEAMLGMVQREGVGAVGPKLLFPDETIQHAGVVMLGGLPGHAYYRWPKDSAGYALGAKVDRNYIAVTGACVMTPKKLFDEIGGFSDRYPLNYNDIDYCLRLLQRGYRSVYMADVVLYHYEGVSKEGGRSVAESEIEKFLEDWSGFYFHDPYYNRNLNQSIPYQFG